MSAASIRHPSSPFTGLKGESAWSECRVISAFGTHTLLQTTDAKKGISEPVCDLEGQIISLDLHRTYCGAFNRHMRQILVANERNFVCCRAAFTCLKHYTDPLDH